MSWESIGRAQLANPHATLRDATVQVRVVDHDDDLFSQIDEIYKHGYVLVRGADRSKLAGIVTAHDLARQFGALARPFSLVEEAELRIRRQVFRCLPDDLIARNTTYGSAPTFGRYRNILSSEDTFTQLGWQLHHETFMALFGKVIKIRNELMHFSSDTLPPEDLAAIENFVQMLQTVDRQP